MFSRAAATTLVCAVLLVGCQNAPNQMSLYAPFGPSAVPAPSLTRANSTPYYTPGDSKSTTPASPSTAANPDNKNLSHYDPYRGIMIPGNFTPAPVLARSTETWGSGSNTQIASSLPRERASNEAAIRVVEGPNSSGGLNSIASQSPSSRSGGVQFNATPLSGAIRSGASLNPQPTATTPTTFNAVEVARLPKPPAIPSTIIPTTPVSNPDNTTPGLFPTPSLSPPPAPKPGEPRRISLWNDPGDGSRVEPASYVESSAPVSMDAGNWRLKK
jgi:hypothetical protein